MLKPRYMIVIHCYCNGEDLYRIVNGPFESLRDAENFIDINNYKYHRPLEVIQTWSK